MNERKILIIDDEITIANMIKDYLDLEGYQTFIALDPLRGIELAKKEKPDLIMLDVLMPKMGGLECLQKIRAVYPEAIIIVVSGLQNEGIAKEAIEQGAYDYITKPFDFQYLQSNILDRIFSS